MNWRWDQGRLEYFRVRNVRKIAEVLVEFDGVVIGETGVRDVLRQPLILATGLLFPPTRNPAYKIWRNFGRVFGEQLLAAQLDKTLRVSELCRRMAGHGDPLTDEEFIQLWVKRYTSPSPSFEDYDRAGRVVFPFCAITSWLLRVCLREAVPSKLRTLSLA